MKKFFIKYITILSLTSALSAIADTTHEHSSLLDGKNYLKIKAGLDMPNKIGGNTNLNAGETNYVMGASIGRQFLSFLLLDLEYIYFGKNKAQYQTSSTTQTTWNIQSNVLMANLRLNLLKDFEIMPYVKAGAGISRNKSFAYTTSGPGTLDTYGGKTVNSFAWQVGIGFSFEYNKIIGTELEYTYVNRGKVRTQGYLVQGDTSVFNGGISGTLMDNVVTFGIKLHF
jgi:opacity protein-like surface antigen